MKREKTTNKIKGETAVCEIRQFKKNWFFQLNLFTTTVETLLKYSYPQNFHPVPELLWSVRSFT